MPYKTKAAQLEYQRKWMQRRRAEWFEKKACTACGSSHNLELDHKDPKYKIDHRVWSWSKKRMDAELAKCQVLCTNCHKLKTRWQALAKVKHGTLTMYSKFGCRCYYCKMAKRHLDPRRPSAINPRVR